jgi:hypothetical protein
MFRSKYLAVVAAVAVAAVASPAWAQRGRGTAGNAQGEPRGAAVPRNAPRTGDDQRRGGDAPRPQTVSPDRGGPQRRGGPPAAPPRQSQPQPRRVDPEPRRVEPPSRRVEPQPAPRSNRALPQGRTPDRVDPSRVSPGSRGSAVIRPGYRYTPQRPDFVAPRYTVRLPRPYYSFRPRVQISLGLFVGSPFAYPSWYNPYRGSSSSYYGPRLARYGGISFDIEPSDTDVFVDGYFVGTAWEFSPYEGPLTLSPGRHRVELRAPGYRYLTFDVNVLPGQVIPYRGRLGY